LGYDIDTTKTRDVEKSKKNLGSLLLDIPQEVVKLPIRILRGVSYGLVYTSTSTGIYDMLKNPSPYGRFSPILGYDGKRFGLKFGAAIKLYNNLKMNDQIMLELSYSTRRYQSFLLRYRSLKNKKLNNFEFVSYFKKRTRERFYGLGNNSRKINEANFKEEIISVNAAYYYRYSSKTSIAVNFGFDKNNYFDGKDYEYEQNLNSIINNQIYNIDENFFVNNQFVKFGVDFVFNSTDSDAQPSNGVLIKSGFYRFQGVNLTDNLNFNKYFLEISKYYNLWRKRIITTRLILSRVNADENINLPISTLNRLGGIDVLRGYSKDRFLDNDIALFTIEYRYPIFDNVDAFIFLEEGRTFSNIIDEKFLSDWKYSTGFGLRIWKADGVQLMPVIADGDENMKFHFVMEANW
jgi:hypothetical protein